MSSCRARLRLLLGAAVAPILLTACVASGTEDDTGFESDPSVGTRTADPIEQREQTGAPAEGDLSGSDDGDDRSAAPLAPQELDPFFGPAVTARDEGAFGLDRGGWVDPVTEPGPAGATLRVAFPAGSVSPSATREYGAPGGGMQVFLPLREGPLDQAHLRYWVRLPSDFEFVKGGKLPGLYGGTEVSGGEEPDGTDGFSTRLMWRREGQGEVYLYAKDESGTSLGRGDWTWPTGTWVCVEQRVVLNDPGDDNGSVAVSLDGREVFTTSDLEYRTVDSLQVEGIFFSTFYGGADPSWAPEQDQHIDFADFAISPDPIGCDTR